MGQIANSTIHELALRALQLSDNPHCFRLCRVLQALACSSDAVLLDGARTVWLTAEKESLDNDVNRGGEHH